MSLAKRRRFRIIVKSVLRAVSFTCVLGACVLPAAAASRAQSHRAAGFDPADWLVAQLRTTEWQSAYPAWRAKHHAVACREFRGDGSALFIVDLWTYRCTSTLAEARANSFFYLLDRSDPPASRLRQFQGEITQTPRLPISVMQRMHDRIEARLTRLYGKPETPESLPPGIAAFGSADWHLICIWHLPDRELYLYLRQSPGRPMAVGLLARDRVLLAASTAEGEHLLVDEQPTSEFEDQVDNRLATVLAKSVPRAAALLGDSSESSGSSGADLHARSGNVFAAINALLNKTKSASPDSRAALLLAADRLAEQWPLPPVADLPSDLVDRINRLTAAAGLHFSWDSLGSAWVYQHDLLRTIWRTAPDTEWGQDAFVFLLERGWDTSGVCQAGTDQFRAVIEQGNQFLQKYPQSPVRSSVSYLMAQAYETWWSLSQWSSCSPTTDLGATPCPPAPGAAQYVSGAGDARAKAIEIYRSLMAASPATYGTPALRRHLARLEAGIDTNQRRYYCLYD